MTKVKEANFAFSGDFEDDEPELAQCDCCGEMKPVDDIDFIPYYALGNSAGCDTYQCQDCRDRAWKEKLGFPTEREIERSQARVAAVLGPEKLAKMDAERIARERKQARFNSVLPTKLEGYDHDEGAEYEPYND